MPIIPIPPSLHGFVETLNHVMRQILWMPDQASTLAEGVDWLQYFQVTIYAIVSVLYIGTTIYFLVRYRRREEGALTPSLEATGLVTGYGVGVFGLFLVFWFIGYEQYVEMRTPPPDALDVYVVAKQWTWKFAYSTGGGSVGILYVPVHRRIRLLMTSRDVIHSFFVPAFRLKQDVVPGTYTMLWFEATHPGTFQVMCAQMCGPGHARMWAQIVALAPEEYARWRRGMSPGPTPPAGDLAAGVTPTLTPVDAGRDAAVRYGCLKCHSVDGQPHIGPTWRGLYGSTTRLASGATQLVDEAYITRSMMDPAADVVAGFAPVMPSYQGLVSPADTAAIIEYLKSLRDISEPHVVGPLPAAPIKGIAAPPRGSPVPPGARSGGQVP